MQSMEQAVAVEVLRRLLVMIDQGALDADDGLRGRLAVAVTALDAGRHPDGPFHETTV